MNLRKSIKMRAAKLATVLLGCLVLFVLTGCGPGQRELMPLEVGKSWTYHVIAGLNTPVESVKVVRPVAVDGVEGYELNGPLGVSRLAWKQNSLIAGSTANLIFHPALPLLAANGKKTAWAGEVTWLGRAIKATADISQEPNSLQLSPRTLETIKSTVVLHLPSRSLFLETWFAPTQGIVKQIQRGAGNRVDIELDVVQSS